MTERTKKQILGLGIGLFTAAIMMVAWFKYWHLGYNGFDLAIYNQTFWNTIHGRLFANSMNPPSYLGDHAEWPILVLAPFYALLPHPLTLVFFQTLALGLSAILIWKITKQLLPGKKMELFFALLWLANPFVWNLALFEFHIITFSVPLILLAAYFYLRQRYWPFIISIIGILAVREDLFLVVNGFALLAIADMLRHRIIRDHGESPMRLPRFARNDVLKWIVVPIILSLAFFFFDQTIISYFNPDGQYKFFTYYSWLGSTPFSIASGAILHPLKVILHIFTWNTAEVALVLVLPTLFLPLWRPRFLLLCLLPAAEFMLTRQGVDMVVVKGQYIAPFLPALALASINGLAALKQKGKYFWRIVPPRLFPFFLVIATITVWFGFGPGLGITSSFPQPTDNKQALIEAMAIIPKDATIVSPIGTITSLSSRQGVWPLDYVWIGEKQFGMSAFVLPSLPDYILLDERDFITFASTYRTVAWSAPYYAAGAGRLRKLISDGRYGVVYENKSVALLKAGIGGPLPFIKIYSTSAPKIEHPAIAASGPIKFLGWSAEKNNERFLYFSADNKVSGDPVAIINNNIFTLGTGLYPPTDWQPGEIVEIKIWEVAPPLKMKIANITGGLYINGDGSLTPISNLDGVLGPEITLP